MRQKSTSKQHSITLEFKNGVTRTVKVKAATREVAEERALKRNPSALGVKRNA